MGKCQGLFLDRNRFVLERKSLVEGEQGEKTRKLALHLLEKGNHGRGKGEKQ